MKKLLLVYLALLVASVALAQRFPPGPLVSSKKAAAGGGGGGSGFSDDFDRSDSDSLGANWTEVYGDGDIASNQLSFPATFDLTSKEVVYSGQAAGSAAHYVKGTVNGGGIVAAGPILRYTDASSAYYEVRFDNINNLARWYHWTAPGGTPTLLNDQSLTVSLPFTFGVTIDGTGSSTVIRIWSNPTANAPTSASLWDGSGPAASFTFDPSPAVDTGSYVGLGGIANDSLTFDNFFGGPTP